MRDNDYRRITGEISAFEELSNRIDYLEDEMEENFSSITEENLRLSVPYVRDEGKSVLGLKLSGNKLYIYAKGTEIGYVTIGG